MFWLKLHVSVNISVNSRWNYHKPLQTMTRTTTNDDMNHHKSQITTNHHKPWHKPPWTMTETSTKHDMNHYKSPQTMTWTIMMTQKELCIKPYGFLVTIFASDCDSFYHFPIFIINALMLSTALHFTRHPSCVWPMSFPLWMTINHFNSTVRTLVSILFAHLPLEEAHISIA